PPVLAMEHVPANFQSNLDEWRRTSLSDPDSFAERVGWGDLGWADFAVYRPLIETAGAVRAHIVGTDRPAFGAIGSLSADALLEVAPTYGLQTEDIIPLLIPDIINARCETVDEQMARRIALDQMERERIMAGRLIAGRGRGSSTLYIGARAHVRADAAIPYLLERTDRPPTMLRIAAYTADEWSTLTGGQGLTGLGLEGRFDFVVIAGHSDVSEADRCDQMREAMGLN
ncbi:MAG: ChaN family lipoprotein, partial [Pseudomonadota bacterium]